MQHLRVRELLDLARSDVPDVGTHLQKMYEWHFEHAMTTAKAILGAGASIVAAVVVAYWKQEIKVGNWQPVVALVFALITFFYGVVRYREVRAIHRQYVAA